MTTKKTTNKALIALAYIIAIPCGLALATLGGLAIFLVVKELWLQMLIGMGTLAMFGVIGWAFGVVKERWTTK